MQYLPLLVVSVLWSVSLWAETKYEIEIFASESALLGEQKFSGRMKAAWTDSKSDSCFYLAYNDRNYFWDPSQNVSSNLNQNEQFKPSFGDIKVVSISRNHSYESPFLLRIPAGEGKVSINFDFQLPQWTKSGKTQYLFHRFYPQRLAKCPTSKDTSFQYEVDPGDYRAQVNIPKRWSLGTPAYQDGTQLQTSGRFLVFNLSLGYKVDRAILGRIPVTIVYQTPEFLKNKKYLLQFLNEMERLVGPYPYERLLVVESEELERPAIPGIITVNRLRQVGMGSIQAQYLNWTLWQLAYFTAQQWFGASTWSANSDNNWFFRGTSEFLASLILAQQPELNNIVAANGGEPWLKFNYNQSADLIASLLNILSPNSQLVDEMFNLYRPVAEQHNFDYIRHFLLLRFLHWYLGDDLLKSLASFYLDFKGKASNHLDFLHHMMRDQHQQKQEISRYFQMWWSQSSWPDFALSDLKITKTKSGYSVTGEVEQPDRFRLPYDIGLDYGTNSGANYRFSADQNRFAIDVPKAPSSVEINPGREIFDSDRFNNSNEVPDVVFFPGNARTIRDDAYTVIWFPFVGKLPGEGTSVLLGTQFFRYVNSGLSVLLSHVPSEKRTGYNAVYLTKLQSISGIGSISAVENFGPGLKNQRIVDAQVSHSLGRSVNPIVSLGARLRQRESLDKGDKHGTLALFSTIESAGSSSCGYRLYGISESTITDNNFEYQRSFGVAHGHCQFSELQLKLRGFNGVVQEEGEVPSFVQFGPQTLEEARIRIDTPELSSVQRIWTIGLDFEISANLPISSSFFLMPKRSTWRFFYDYGESKGPSYKYTAYGMGFRIPLGGDVVGKRSLAIANISVLAVLGKQYEGQDNKKPGILVDFLGKL